jgi:sterol desaturase/sphingolipid hydroxylase (fatty acid hydroxylase superfamily)
VNYGLIFTLFDRLLGTYSAPERGPEGVVEAAPSSR